MTTRDEGRKPRLDSRLDFLPPEMSEQLLDWVLSRVPYHEIAQRLRESGVETSVQAISRWWRNRGAEEWKTRRSQATDMAQAVTDEARANPGRFDEAALEAIRERIFRVAMDPTSSVKDDLAPLLKALLKREDQTLAREKWRAEIRGDTEKAIDAFAAEIAGDAEAEALVQRLRERVLARMEKREAGKQEVAA